MSDKIEIDRTNLEAMRFFNAGWDQAEAQCVSLERQRIWAEIKQVWDDLGTEPTYDVLRDIIFGEDENGQI